MKTDKKYTKNINKSGIWFFLKWTLGTILAFGFSLLFVEIGERPELPTFEAIIGAAIVGISQYLMLRGRLNHAWLWPLACMMGWGLITGSGIGAMGWVTPRTNILALRTIYGFIFGAIAGSILGTMQWLVLRKQAKGAIHWLWANPLCWGIALALGWTIAGWLRLFANLFLFEVVGLTVTWFALGITTGIVLNCLKWRRILDLH